MVGNGQIQPAPQARALEVGVSGAGKLARVLVCGSVAILQRVVLDCGRVGVLCVQLWFEGDCEGLRWKREAVYPTHRRGRLTCDMPTMNI